MKIYSVAPGGELLSTSSPPPSEPIEVVISPVRGRQGRQQNGDTYTLEIAFPAVKYVYD